MLTANRKVMSRVEKNKPMRKDSRDRQIGNNGIHALKNTISFIKLHKAPQERSNQALSFKTILNTKKTVWLQEALWEINSTYIALGNY
ncbi:hypothetical protein KM043_014132 [Ampulex compressa]|nr:hypothetical protein KM043_014132 [Ampulex compressa]